LADGGVSIDVGDMDFWGKMTALIWRVDWY
jgi:hypothetical protein